MTDIF